MCSVEKTLELISIILFSLSTGLDTKLCSVLLAIVTQNCWEHTKAYFPRFSVPQILWREYSQSSYVFNHLANRLEKVSYFRNEHLKLIVYRISKQFRRLLTRTDHLLCPMIKLSTVNLATWKAEPIPFRIARHTMKINNMKATICNPLWFEGL